MKKAKKSNKKS